MPLMKLTLCGGIFVLAIALLRALALRRLPKQTFVTLWWAAALRLLIPLELPSQFSVYTLLESLGEKPVTPVPQAVSTIYVPAAALPVQPPEPVRTSTPLWPVLWTAGGAVLALWFLAVYIHWRRRFRESLPAGDLNQKDFLRRRIQIRTSDRIAAPLTYGGDVEPADPR